MFSCSCKYQGPNGQTTRSILFLGVMGAMLIPGPAPATGVAQPGELRLSCNQLATGLAGAVDARIASAEPVERGVESVGGKPIAEHCKILGAMNERKGALDMSLAIGFEIRLPRQWNGRLWYQANGGIDGSVKPAMGALGGGPLTSALLQGFAVVSSDAGHSNRLTRGPGFGYDPQARLDYGYQAVGKLMPLAERVVNTAYGRDADTRYIGGCSNGGRHALVAASRYPEMFDGYLVGAPGYRLPLAAIANIFGAQQYARVATDPADLSTAFTATERRTVADAILKQCDALDGIADGMVMAGKACQEKFDLAKHVPTCKGVRDGSCLSSGQHKAIGAIFAGATTTEGKPFYAPFPYDTGIVGKGVSRWEFTAPLKLDSGAVGMIWAVPPVNPKGFDGAAFVLKTPVDELLSRVAATNETFTESALSFMMPPNPTDLSAVRNKGAKILAYHGNSDAIFSVADTEAWIDGLNATHNGKVGTFARLFKVPGMDHCRGGPAADQFDMITPLVRWVEQGKAPESIVAKVRGPGNAGGVNEELPAGWSPTRTRLLCPYPQVSVYNGTGNSELSESFSCKN